MGRKITTSDGNEFTGKYWEFTDKDSYVLYGRNPFNKVKISRSSITTDQKSYFPEVLQVIGGIVIIVIVAAVAGDICFGSSA